VYLGSSLCIPRRPESCATSAGGTRSATSTSTTTADVRPQCSGTANPTRTGGPSSGRVTCRTPTREPTIRRTTRGSGATCSTTNPESCGVQCCARSFRSSVSAALSVRAARAPRRGSAPARRSAASPRTDGAVPPVRESADQPRPRRGRTPVRGPARRPGPVPRGGGGSAQAGDSGSVAGGSFSSRSRWSSRISARRLR
jgi:hypothetical protein